MKYSFVVLLLLLPACGIIKATADDEDIKKNFQMTVDNLEDFDLTE